MEDKRRLLVLYGSQTGTAKNVAERIGRESRRRWFEPIVMSMNAYNKFDLPTESYVIFVASTTGQGEVPDNMKAFWRFLLRKNLPSDSLSGVHMSVFGLGDSGYPIYNAVARRLYQRLLNLGARVLHPRGLGDDQHRMGFMGALEPWLKEMWSSLLLLCPLPPGRSIIPDSIVAPPSYAAAILPRPAAAAAAGGSGDSTLAPDTTTPAALDANAHANTNASVAGSSVCTRSFDGYTPFFAHMTENTRITHPGHEQDVRHVEFDLKGSGIHYEPGDVLLVHPRNDAGTIQAFIEQLGIDGEALVSLSVCEQAWEREALLVKEKNNELYPTHVTVRELFEAHLDLLGSPSRHFFQVAATFAGGIEKERLEEFGSIEYQNDMYKYCTRERRTYIEVFGDFKSIRPPALPWGYFFSLVPRLQPRQFSIASSPLKHGRVAQLCVALLEFKTHYGREKEGVCSSFLAALSQQMQGGEKVRVPIWFKKGSFRLPTSSYLPTQAQAQAQEQEQEQEQEQGQEQGQKQMPSAAAPSAALSVSSSSPFPSVPIVMVGPGTGIAPFRSLTHQILASRHAREQASLSSSSRTPITDSGSGSSDGGDSSSASMDVVCGDDRLAVEDACVMVFTGNRYQGKDYLYGREWEEMSGRLEAKDSAGTQQIIHCPAFSRDQEKKEYVQHKMTSEGVACKVWDALYTKKGYFLLAGSAKQMPRNVQEALLEIAMMPVGRGGGMSEEQAKRWLKDMQLRGKYQVETW